MKNRDGSTTMTDCSEVYSRKESSLWRGREGKLFQDLDASMLNVTRGSG